MAGGFLGFRKREARENVSDSLFQIKNHQSSILREKRFGYSLLLTIDDC
jgi:hypothetical protein